MPRFIQHIVYSCGGCPYFRSGIPMSESGDEVLPDRCGRVGKIVSESKKFPKWCPLDKINLLDSKPVK